MAPKDPYQELGVARTASADEVRRAFRKLAKQYHPDKNPGDKAAEERFKRVSTAFDLLSDEDKRKKFDRGEIDADGRETRHWLINNRRAGQLQSRHEETTGGGGPGGFGGAQFDGVGPERHPRSDVFGSQWPAGRGPDPRPTKGGDLRARLEVDLEEAINGGRKRIAFSDGRTIDVTIPKGAFDGQTLRLKGQGSPGRAGPARRA